MSSNLFCTLRSHRRHVLACSVLLLAALVSVHAEPLPFAIDPLSYGATIDLITDTATFAIRFDRTPDFTSVDEFGRIADQFQLWTDTVSTNPFQSTTIGTRGNGPLGTQMMVAMSDLPVSNLLSYIWPQLLSDPGPRDPGNWGSVEAQGSYTLAPDNTLSFVVPLALLRASDGEFNYQLQTFRYGGWNGADYFGVSGAEYGLCVPEPAHGAMLGAGMLLLAGVGRRGRKPR